MITPFREDKTQPASYDLTVGAEYYIHDQTQHAESAESRVSKLENKDIFWIPPNAICIVLTEERLTMPDDIVAGIVLPLRLLKSGLIMAPQTQIDPGYSGKLVALLYNLSDRKVKLGRGDHLVTLEFRFIDEVPTKQYKGPSIDYLSDYITNPLNSSLFDMNSKVAAAVKKVDEYGDKHISSMQRQMTFLGILVGLIGALFSLIMAKVGWELYFGSVNQKQPSAESSANLTPTHNLAKQERPAHASPAEQVCAPLDAVPPGFAPPPPEPVLPLPLADKRAPNRPSVKKQDLKTDVKNTQAPKQAKGAS